MVVFSGGESKTLNDVYRDVHAIYDGGGTGSIMGRNAFQRPRAEALAMLNYIQEILLGRKASHNALPSPLSARA